MKRVTMIIVMLFVVFITVALSCSVVAEGQGNELISGEPGFQLKLRKIEYEPPTKKIESESVLPASLVTIEDGAFEGTSLSSVTLSENIEEIGDSAFANNDSLFTVTVLGAVEKIHDQVFAGSTDVTVRAASGTYAKYWAQKHGVQYESLSFFVNAEDQATITAVLPAVRSGRERTQRTGVCSAEKKANRTGRPATEIKLPKYSGNASELVQSRYFP